MPAVKFASKTAKSLLFIQTLILALTFSLTGMAQVGHPAKGSWSGDLVSESGETERIRLLIDDAEGELTTTVNPGRRAVEAGSTALDAPVWGLVIKADLPEGALVLEGTLSNLGSWTNRKFIGTYTLGDDEGEFEITLN